MSQSVVPKTGKNECDTEQSFQDTDSIEVLGQRAKIFFKVEKGRTHLLIYTALKLESLVSKKLIKCHT